MRVIEQLRLDWLANSIGVKRNNPITVASLPSIIKDLKCQGTKYGSALDYFESMNLINIKAFTSLDLSSIHMDLIPVDESVNVTKRVIITYLEKDWVKSYDDYVNLQIKYDGIDFAYDGLEINY